MFQIPYQFQQPVYTNQQSSTSYSPYPLDPSASTPSLYLSSGYSTSSTNPLSAPATPNNVNPGTWSLEQQQAQASQDFPFSPYPTESQAKQERVASMLQLVSFTPKEGEESTQVQVIVNAIFPFTPTPGHFSGPPPPKTLRILFGQLPVPTKVTNIVPVTDIEGNESFDGLTLYADAPDPVSTGCMPAGNVRQYEPFSVTVMVQVLGADNRVLETKPMGRFTYQQGRFSDRSTPFASPHVAAPRLVRRQGDLLTPNRSSPLLGPPNATLMRRGCSENGQIAGQSPELAGHPYRPEYPSRYSMTPTFPPDGQHSPYYAPTYPSPNTNGAPPREWQTPPEPSRSHYGAPPQPSPLQQSPHENPASASGSPGPGHAPGSQPSLMRTSQLSGNPTVLSTYVVTNTKASLVLQQDLNLMAVGWNQEEWQAKRRLVQFWRRQEGSSIHAAFRAISQAEYIPNSIVISCIYREDKNECFVTSVDAIYLLEALVGLRFSVEEKNRIRRNLEGFRPITVSKNKAGAEDFFKLVMSFPNPKPRNIEKDVKVFPWKIFGTALKKIIGKYSANYALPPNANMAPPQMPILTRQPSPPVEPYTIPAPLMPAPLAQDSLSVQFPPYPTSRSVPPPDKPEYSLDGDDGYYGSGHGQHGMPPTPSSYNGLSSNSSSSLPTLSNTSSNHNVEIHHGDEISSLGRPTSNMMDQTQQLTYPSNMAPFGKHNEGFPMAPPESHLPLRAIIGANQDIYQ